MKTIKRMPADIKVSGLSNMTKYFNQMQFNGIKEDDNIYAIDQMSLRDAKNVYIDDNLRLVSRPTLQYSDLPPEIPAFSELVDIKDFGFGKIYITKSVLNKYSVIVVSNTPVTPIAGATFIIEELTNYHIATIEHYVICFNNVNAKIFDTNKAEQGWQNLTSYAEIPVVKRYIGDTITTYDKNYFIPDLYKEEYIWSNESHPILPTTSSLIADQTTDTLLTTSLGNYSGFRMRNPEYELVLPTNTNAEPLYVSAAKNILCIAKDGTDNNNYFSISYTYGRNFDKVYYPNYEGTLLPKACSVSRDGKYFFITTTFGVYRCNLADLTWSKPFAFTDTIVDGYSWLVDIASSYFLTGDVFSICLRCYNSRTSFNDYRLYFKGPGLYDGDDYTDDHMDSSLPSYYQLSYINKFNLPQETTLKDFFNYSTYVNFKENLNLRELTMDIITDSNNREVATIVLTKTILPSIVRLDSILSIKSIFIYGGDTSTQATSLQGKMYSQGHLIEDTANDSLCNYYVTARQYDTANIGLTMRGVLLAKPDETYNYGEYSVEIQIGKINNTYTYNYSILETIVASSRDYTQIRNYWDLAIPYKDKYIISTTILPKIFDANRPNVNIYEVSFAISPFRLSGYGYQFIITDENVLYGTLSESTNNRFTIWTSYMQDSDSLSLKYKIGSAGHFTQVPTVSYSDTELYLAFDNLLQITYNTKDPDDPTKTLFNLPKINNQSFIDKITAIINISTTEIAIFFLNKIIICSKVADENLVQGFRYDYYNTKLSTGVRLGDSVINTLEGSFTLFPTLRGLAAMNYQAFMATTDQTISYITDTVKDMWTKFYNDSEQIRIIQWRNRLVLTNGTGTILLYDLTTQAWWRWELSRDVLVALSNQLDLQVINGTLLTFKENVDQYYDFGEHGEFSEIDWYIMSQPLHFNAPNYYKNIKQLVFQMSETEDEKSTKTMDAQIKLYRKKITIREPETVKFKIEELRTFVKRFNYWKINELQWGISNDTETSTPKRLELNGMSVKYEIGEEVR